MAEDEVYLQRIAALLAGENISNALADRLGLTSEELTTLLAGDNPLKSRSCLVELTNILSQHERGCWAIGYEIRQYLLDKE